MFTALVSHDVPFYGGEAHVFRSPVERGHCRTEHVFWVLYTRAHAHAHTNTHTLTDAYARTNAHTLATPTATRAFGLFKSYGRVVRSFNGVYGLFILF